jgi:hypothetical protein
MAQITTHRRPHYPPTERIAILELRAARGWTQVQTAKPQTLVKGQPGVRLELVVTFEVEHKHLPVVTLRRVA